MDSVTDFKAVLNAILMAAVDAIIVVDSKGTIVCVNHATCRLFQYSQSELTGQNVSVLMPKDVSERHDGYIFHHIETGENRIIGVGREVEGKRKDGSLVPLRLSVGEAVVDDQPMFVGILRDLTRRKAIEAALARSQRLDAIGQMTGGVVHDFNNLLTIIIGNLELLQMGGVREDQKELVQDALDSAELGADLTSRLMVFARRSNLKPERTNLREICEEALAILKRALGSPYTIKTDFDAEIGSVMVDPVQLQSALMNLVLNARDAMGEKGELLISVSNITIDDTYLAQEVDMEPGEYVRLSVSDDGDGMSPEAQKRAFEPFFTTKTEGNGNGLGLATVYGFVRQSGGHVTLYSEPGLGTSIGLYFPALPENTGKDRPLPTKRKAGGVAPGRGETILIVEDNPKVRKVTVQRIVDLGYKAKVAESADTAYRMLRSGTKADVLFSDLVMPGTMNGYDLAAKVNEEFPDVKVLLTSGYASDIVTTSMAHDRLYDILHKPYRQSDLARRLHALLADTPDA